MIHSNPSSSANLPTLKVFHPKLDKLVLPPNASIISFDAISMYTNIGINDSIECISTFLAETWDNYDCKAVKEAMEIVMKKTALDLAI